MKTMHRVRAGMGMLAIAAVSAGLSGCMSGPTYGTSKTATEQLVDDLGDSVSISSKDGDKKAKYNPRPALVVNKNQEGNLPAPQASLASRENNPNWVESPEETRDRLRNEAQANENNPNYRSPLLAGNGTAGQLTESQKWEAFREAKKRAEAPSGITGSRGTLTDPPTQYRVADTNDLNDLGEPEMKKEQKRKKEAAATGSDSSWWKPFQ